MKQKKSDTGDYEKRPVSEDMGDYEKKPVTEDREGSEGIQKKQGRKTGIDMDASDADDESIAPL